MGKHPKATLWLLSFLALSVDHNQCSVHTISVDTEGQPYQQTRKYHKALQYSLGIPEIGFAKTFETLFYILP